MADTIDKLKSMAAKIFGGGRTDVERGTGLQKPVTKEMEPIDRVAIRHDRRTTIQDCCKMEKLDVRVSRMHQKLASDAVVGGLTINVESALTDKVKEQAQGIIDKIMERCKIQRNLKGWTHNCLREGDTFLEVIVDDKTKEIIRLKRLATIITFNNMNSEGNFPENAEAYYQEHPYTRQKIKTFERWQICQVSWEYEEGKPYGTPMFASARLAYERLDSGEKNMVIRRAIRAGVARHHKVGTDEKPGTWEEVKDYREQNKDTLAKPMDAAQDFYSTGNVTITELKGDTTLGETTDLEYFEGLLAMRSGIPTALLGGGRERSVNRDVLDEQEEDYFRVVADINDTFEYGLRQVFDFGLLLAGINPESVTYEFVWGAKDRDDVDKKIARAANLQKLGYSFETIFQTCALDGIDIEEELERIEKQVEEGVIPYGLGMKLDPNVLMVLGMAGAAQGAKTEEVTEKLERIAEVAERQLGGHHPFTQSAVKSMIALKRARDIG